MQAEKKNAERNSSPKSTQKRQHVVPEECGEKTRQVIRLPNFNRQNSQNHLDPNTRKRLRRKFARVLCVQHRKLKHLAQLWPSSGLGAKKKLDMSLDFPNLVEVTSDIPKKSRGEIRESFVRKAHIILLSRAFHSLPWPSSGQVVESDGNDDG